jgi:hypothetical protein
VRAQTEASELSHEAGVLGKPLHQLPSKSGEFRLSQFTYA